MADNKNQGNKSNSERGFASMDEDKQRAIASEGGKAAHEKGTAHEFDSEEAREAGRKGGQARASNSGSSESSSHSGGSQGSGSSSQRGGGSEHHAEAGRQSHKND